MKKIDLHIHTTPSKYEEQFKFSQEKLKKYVEDLSIDCIAITNHNCFDMVQYNEIVENLGPCKVFPGVEIDLESGHLLLISENDGISEFAGKCGQLSSLIRNKSDSINVEQLKTLFGDLNKYLLIPHIDKRPSIQNDTLKKLKDYIFTGEVTSYKKFKSVLSDSTKKLTPLIFSDLRFTEEMEKFSTRQTYLDINDLTLKSIKTCLLDKTKVSLSKKGGVDYFQIFGNGQLLSTGLNVILGERSSGKSYTLRKINEMYPDIKYIKQFELLERDEEKDLEKFKETISIKQRDIAEEYLKEFKSVVDDVSKINQKNNLKVLEEYVESLLEVASEEEKKDVYSQTVLYNETEFTEFSDDSLKRLIDAVKVLIENTTYQEIIERHVNRDNLNNLIVDLIEKYNVNQVEKLKKNLVNSLVKNIQGELQSFSSSTKIKEIDLYKIKMEQVKLKKFENIVKLLKQERNIERNDIRRFKVAVNTILFNGAQGLKNKSGVKKSFQNAYSVYDKPIDFLEELKKIEIPNTDYYKYFIDIEYTILNEHGTEVSGGERSEFNLLNKIKDAHHHDLLLIDELESSFDNLFLKNEVNEQIKEIAKKLPVVIVTHNNTIGASIQLNYILYAKKEIVNKAPVYKLYSGHLSDLKLKTVDGEEIDNYAVQMDCLEAGNIAYRERGKFYETLKDSEQ